MTEKELFTAYQTEFGVTADEARKSVEFVTNTIVEKAMADGKCAFGKTGTFKASDVAAKPARTGVKNPLTNGTYDVAAKPARKKLTFALSKSGKLIGA